MRLTLQAEHAVRALMYLALRRDRLSTIAECYEISRNNLMKVAHTLGVSEFIVTVRGRSGGLKLARAPKDINIGEVVRLVESQPSSAEFLTERVDKDPMVGLRRALGESVDAFYDSLGQYSLKSLVDGNDALKRLIFEGGSS
ncbi:Rrf2 family transcriptional regulator [uncultured Tateyamaria sp.]|uniref:RrF2 family transcriptional regulator n=1 Tax=uncultured Tateyamaria sp. TaxID=455651 RepID=UPI00261B1760|nr:Rrf2 family transcriptional regulator [uncultured Tateyamaria sp.]